MSLLREIQSDTVDANVDVSVVLRKCKVLAARLGNKEFKLWVEHELNGYPSKDDLPEYRVIRGIGSYGNFITIGWKSNNAPIPTSNIPEKYLETLTTMYWTEPISYFSSLVTQQGDQSTLNLGWPADLIAYLSDDIRPSWQLTQAWRVIATSSLVAMLDTVRNRILSFVLEIEAEAPDAGEALPNVKPIDDKRVNQVFNTYIQGNVDSLMAGSQTITHNTEITVIQNDLESLKQYLESIGIGEPDLKKLDQAIQEDAESAVKGNLGDKVKTWLGKMVSKAGSSTWNIATSVATNLLIKALSAYYGFEL